MFVVIWGEQSTFPTANSRAQRFDLDGQRLWGDTGIVWSTSSISQSVAANAPDDVQMVNAPGGVVIAAQHAFDVQLHRINHDGTLGASPDAGGAGGGAGGSDGGGGSGGSGGAAGGIGGSGGDGRTGGGCSTGGPLGLVLLLVGLVRRRRR